MARTDTLGNFLTDVADAIREKKETTEAIQASNFDTEIANLPSGGSDLDWQSLGFSGTPQDIVDNYNYSKSVKDNWVKAENLSMKFRNDKTLVYMPSVDTEGATNCHQMFEYCSNLKEVLWFDTSKATTMNSIFDGCLSLTTIPFLDASSVNKTNGLNQIISNCQKLTDESLDNILKTCISAVNYNGTKTFRILTTSTYYKVERLQALPHYQDFIDAGWTIGY